MPTTRDDLRRWFDEGVEQGATHMIVACDTFDYEDYPVYVQRGDDPRHRARNLGSMQTVMEVYKLDPQRKEEQLRAHRVYNYD